MFAFGLIGYMYRLLCKSNQIYIYIYTCCTNIVVFTYKSLVNEAWMILDSQYHLVPQRRNRVWGLAHMANGETSKSRFSEQFLDGLRSTRTNFQFGMDVNFEKPSAESELKLGRHSELVAKAKECIPSQNLFIDCSSSTDRNAFVDGVLPCVTPSHPIFSTALNRYVYPREFLQAQGIWPSLFNESAYTFLLENGAQEFAGNSFTTTVCQSAILAAMTTGAGFSKTLEIERCKANGTYRSGGFKRLRGKQAAICPGPAAERKDGLLQKKQKTKKKRKGTAPHYKRKAEGIDSRKMAKGKKEGATIWQKEKV